MSKTYKYVEIENPFKNIDKEIYNKLIEYPYTFDEIIETVLNAADEINEGLNPEYNPKYY